MIEEQLKAQGRCRRALSGWLHRRPVQPVPDAWALLASTGMRVVELETLAAARGGAIRVLIDPHFVPGECAWCAPARPELATVRICGSPAPGCEQPLRTVEVCHGCAVNPRTGAVRQALIEAGQWRVVVVEVCES